MLRFYKNNVSDVDLEMTTLLSTQEALTLVGNKNAYLQLFTVTVDTNGQLCIHVQLLLEANYCSQKQRDVYMYSCCQKQMTSQKQRDVYMYSCCQKQTTSQKQRDVYMNSCSQKQRYVYMYSCCQKQMTVVRSKQLYT